MLVTVLVQECDFMCSGQRLTRCLFLIIFVVSDASVAAVEPLEELVRLLSWLPERPLGAGAGDPARGVPLPDPFSAGAALVLALALAFAIGAGSGPGAAVVGAIVPSDFGGLTSLSIAPCDNLSTCL